MAPADSLLQELERLSNPMRQESARRFFKEAVDPFGIPAANVRAISKTYYPQLKELDKATLFDECEQLFRTGKLEAAIVACDWSLRAKKQFAPDDLSVFLSWIEKYVTNWAVCDTFCNHTVGELLMRYPDLAPSLLPWTQSHNRWLRRAAAVSFIVPARKGLFLEMALDVAASLLHDPDDLVQKGYGWLLKEASKPNGPAVYAFVMAYKNEMPRTALRYAIEKWPGEKKKAAMEKSGAI